jgi:thymidylate synthase (FAD)
MTINIINAPSIDIDTRAGVYPIHFMSEIRSVWTGYRICYYKNVDYEDARPFPVSMLDEPLPEDADKSVWLADESANKKWHALCDAVIEDTVKAFSKQKALALKYGYALNSTYIASGESLNDIDENIVRERVTSTINNLVNYTRSENEKDVALEIFRFFNACKHITPKLRMGHESPFEHGVITFTLRNVSRSLTHQLVRCRMASYSQSSQRYIGEDPENLSLVLPTAIKTNAEALETVLGYLSKLPEVITKLKELGVKNEDIRCVFPNAIPTDIQVSMNFRELKHFIELRLDSHAQDEIRHIAFDLWVTICNLIPFIWTDIIE